MTFVPAYGRLASHVSRMKPIVSVTLFFVANFALPFIALGAYGIVAGKLQLAPRSFLTGSASRCFHASSVNLNQGEKR